MYTSTFTEFKTLFKKKMLYNRARILYSFWAKKIDVWVHRYINIYLALSGIDRKYFLRGYEIFFFFSLVK